MIGFKILYVLFHDTYDFSRWFSYPRRSYA